MDKTSELEQIALKGLKDITEAAKTVDDGRMVLDDDAWAILWSPKDGFMLRTLFDEQRDGTVPNAALALMACYMRLTADRAFCQEMAEWFLSQKQN